MKIHMQNEDLKTALGEIKGAVDSRPSLPIVANALIEAGDHGVRMTATDMTTTVTTSVRAEVEREGDVLAPAAKLADLVATLPDGLVTVSFDRRATKQGMILIESERSVSHLAYTSPEDYPEKPEIGEAISLGVPAATLREGLEKVMFSVAPSPERPVLNTVMLDFTDDLLTCVSADGFRLSIYRGMTGGHLRHEDLKRSEGGHLKLLVPHRAGMLLLKLLKKCDADVIVDIPASRAQARFTVGHVQMDVRLMKGEYPAYSALVPDKYTTRVEMDRRDLDTAAMSSSMFANTVGLRALRIALDTERGVAVVRSAQSGSGENTGELDAEIEGDAEGIVFQPQFIRDVMKVMDGRVAMEMTTPMAPAVFSQVDGPTDSNYTHVLMPVLSMPVAD